ncbi:D-alanyl-D-alanine carboxypeptidase family protein [Stenotrophomonas lactitubi]|uniref:D-alanyl-D-alanine carboxypeptidase family protein n=1 Tax=Stenotrophomonas lactitubi TaxID=2045214 RepID=UPI0033420DF2
MQSTTSSRSPVSSITIDALSLEILQQQHAELRRPPASLTKLMTAYTAYDLLRQSGGSWLDTITIDPRDVHEVADDETRMGLVPGERIALGRLLEGLMVVSGNDAALALARHLAGSQAAFAQHMNGHARALGLHDTHFISASGITTPGHLSTARDMAMLAAHLLARYPDLLAITAQRSFVHRTLQKANQNALLGENGVDGLKTGYTQAAGFCLAATARRRCAGQALPVRLINVVLGADSRASRDDQVRTQLDAGFAIAAVAEANPV